ncbi:ABC transporter substrate-binding protein, partial [Streptomyces sp. NPDC056653]
MHTIDLAYVGRGLHEELAAYIADQQDYYTDEGTHVALRDDCTWNEERLRHGITIGLGRALLPRLTDGTPWVATPCQHPPPAALVPRPPRPDLPGRPGRPAAGGTRPHTAPGCFTRIVPRRAGLDPDHDIHTIIRPP